MEDSVSFLVGHFFTTSPVSRLAEASQNYGGQAFVSLMVNLMHLNG